MRVALTRSRKLRLAAVVVLAAGLAALVGALAWPTSGAGQGSGQMTNCPQAGKWSVAVWDGASETDAQSALDTCSGVTVEAAFALDPDTQLFSRFFRGRAAVSNLHSLGELEGVLTLGGGGATAAAEDEAVRAAQGSEQMVNCPQAAKWSIAVWDGSGGTAIDAALDTCSTTVEAAFALDPDTQLFSRFFRGRPEVSNLSTLEEHQGVLALGSGSVGPPPPISFEVDGSVTPPFSEVPGLEDGETWPVASVVDEHGNQAEFVADQLIIVTDDKAALDAFLARWEGEIVDSFDPADYGVTDLSPRYLVRINTALADASALEADLRALTNEGQGEHSVSSQQGLDLLAAWASEEGQGVSAGVNWIATAADYRGRTTTEATGTSPAGATIGGAAHSSDAYDWYYFQNYGGGFEIGVGEAWTALANADRLDNRVTIAILDGGFAPDQDFPAGWEAIGPTNVANPLGCGPGNPCPWHGTNVVGAAMGVPDNSYGAAGPGGPVAEAIVIHRAWDTFNADRGIAQARQAGAQIINMSWGVRVPALGGLGLGAFDDATESAWDAGVLVFASAGNDSENVDREDSWGIYEVAWHAPCENSGVICVGALDTNSTSVASYSNYGYSGGGDTVDISGSGTVWVGPDPGNSGDYAQAFSGTSAASPFVAGVAALIWAADPSLSARQVKDILYDTAHPCRGNCHRYVNAYDAVIEALGWVPNPPEISIVTPADGSSFARGSVNVPFTADASDPEDGPLSGASIVWTSVKDGEIGTGTLVERRDLSFCLHTITATATDSDGLSDSESISVMIVSEEPTAQIDRPEDGIETFESRVIELRGTSTNWNALPVPEALPDQYVSWAIDGEPVGTGHEVDIPGGTLAPGQHTITFSASKGSFRCGGALVPGVPEPLEDTDSIDITIVEDPEDMPPDVSIIMPVNQEHFVADNYDSGEGMWYANVFATGSAVDPEEGTVPGEARQWTVSRDGGPEEILFWGVSSNIRLYATECPWSKNEIFLRASDSQGNTGEDSVSIFVELLC